MSAVAEIQWLADEPKPEFVSLFGTSPMGLAECSSKGIVAAVNPAIEELTGVRFSTDKSLELFDLIHPDAHAELKRSLIEVADGKRDSFQIDSIDLAGGRQLLWTIWRIQDATVAKAGLMALAQALPDASAAERRLRQAARLEAIGRLAGGVAHDFNNLLTGILLYCDLLISGIEPGHRARKYAEEIRKAGIQASALVRQLLTVTRPASSQPRLLSLNEIAEGMRNLLVRLCGENIKLKLRLDPALGLIQMDPTHAQQILLNLILNARDAMPHGGDICVETRNCRVQVLTDFERGSPACLSCALLAVEDGGMGFDPLARTHLFEPFFTTKGGRGNGLGLATVHEIVISNGGLIHVSSEPGHGTRISIFLPLAPEPVLSAAPSKDFHPVNDGDLLSSREEE